MILLEMYLFMRLNNVLTILKILRKNYIFILSCIRKILQVHINVIIDRHKGASSQGKTTLNNTLS